MSPSDPMIQGDQSKDVDDGVVEPSSMSCGAYWFHVHVMDAGTLLRGANPARFFGMRGCGSTKGEYIHIYIYIYIMYIVIMFIWL